ncbi:MAG: DUF4384 domain-containing protein [Elusimicrobia bacterium]|nr:DUF4384 domain-containing protein [Elusimicrobiota bacterium]
MLNLKSWLVVILPLLLAACSGAPARRNTYIEDINGIKSKIETVDRELSADIKLARPETVPTPAASQPVKTIKKTPEVFEFESEGEGNSTKYERPIDAEKRAEEDALAKAVRESGVNVYSGFQNVMEETANTSYQFIGKYLSVWSNALVSYEKSGPAACTFAGETHRCSVKIRGKVYFKGDPDPNFELQAALGKPAYFEGDNVNLRVRLTKDAYITVLNCDEDGNVSLIFPNRHARNNFLKAGHDLNIPDDLPFQLKALLPQGRPETGEILHVIATKTQPLVLLDALKEEKNGGFISYSMGGVKDLVTKLSKFSRSDWTAQVIIYGVKKK